MKNLLLVVLLALGSTVNAQLFVKPTATDASFVYVNNTFVYVENDVELETNEVATTATEKGTPSIILRNSAQLLQGEGTVTKDNKGTGDISIYQEGTVGNFDYNFWGSPVGIARSGTNTAVGDGNGKFAFRNSAFENVFFLPQTVRNSNPAFPIVGFDSNLNAGGLNIASFWIYSFKSSTGYAAWEIISNIGELDAGYGFTMKGVTGNDPTLISTETGVNNAGNAQRYDFRGRPNNGDINVEIGPTLDANAPIQTLVGNPYPSALDLNYFLIENSRGPGQSSTFNYSYTLNGNTVNSTINRTSVTTGIAYFWDSNPSVMSHYLVDYQGGYGTYSPVGVIDGTGVYVNAVFYMYDESGTIIPGTDNTTLPQSFARRFSPVGQGFFVSGAMLGSADGDQESTDISFNNRQRVFVQENTSTSQFRSQESGNDSDEPTPGIGVSTYYPDVNNMAKPRHIKFSAGINDTYARELAIAFVDNATEGIDVAMDAPTADNLATDVSFNIEGNNKYVINVVPRDEYQWVPLTLKASGPTEFKFAVHSTEGFEYSDVFLVDRETETYHSILNDEVLMSLEDGIYEDRFFVRFTTADEPEEETIPEETEEEVEEVEDIAINDENPFIEESVLESFTIIQNNNSGQLEIYNPNNVAVNNVSLFDLSGKQIFNELNLGGQEEYTFSTNNLATGVYVVKFVTADGLTKGRKISIVN